MKAQARTQQYQPYQWPVNVAVYDRLALSAAEKAELEFLAPRDGALGMKLNCRNFCSTAKVGPAPQGCFVFHRS